MRFDRLEVYYVSLPLIYPWRTAYGADATIDSVLLHVYSGGHDAWTETTPFRTPTYSPEFTLGVYSLLSEIAAPLLIGQAFDTPDALLGRLSPFKGNPYCTFTPSDVPGTPYKPMASRVEEAATQRKTVVEA